MSTAPSRSPDRTRVPAFASGRGWKTPTAGDAANGKRLFVLPGVPLELKGIFTEELEPEFLSEGSAAVVREIRFNFAVEAKFYPLMRELEEAFPDVSVGSYPNFETKELVIRCIGSLYFASIAVAIEDAVAGEMDDARAGSKMPLGNQQPDSP